jgi:hypothetical protein
MTAAGNTRQRGAAHSRQAIRRPAAPIHRVAAYLGISFTTARRLVADMSGDLPGLEEVA